MGKIIEVSTSPTDLGSCAIWMDAMDYDTLTFSGATVPSCVNKGAAGGSITGSGSTTPGYSSSGINGRPAFTFDSDDFNFVSDSSALDYSAMHVFVVLQRDSDAGASQGFVRKFESTGNQREFQFFINASDAFQLTGSTNGTASTNATTAITATVGTPYVAEGYYDGTNLGCTANNGTVTTAAMASIFNGTGNFVIGRVAGAPLLGKIGELIFFTKALTSAERAVMYAYLKRKWRI